MHFLRKYCDVIFEVELTKLSRVQSLTSTTFKIDHFVTIDTIRHMFLRHFSCDFDSVSNKILLKMGLNADINHVVKCCLCLK